MGMVGQAICKCKRYPALTLTHLRTYAPLLLTHVVY